MRRRSAAPAASEDVEDRRGAVDLVERNVLLRRMREGDVARPEADRRDAGRVEQRGVRPGRHARRRAPARRTSRSASLELAHDRRVDRRRRSVPASSAGARRRRSSAAARARAAHARSHLRHDVLTTSRRAASGARVAARTDRDRSTCRSHRRSSTRAATHDRAADARDAAAPPRRRDPARRAAVRRAGSRRRRRPIGCRAPRAPTTSTSIHTKPRCAGMISRRVGSPTIAASARTPRSSIARVPTLSYSSSAVSATTISPRERLAAPRATPPRTSPPRRPSCRRRRARTADRRAPRRRTARASSPRRRRRRGDR